MSLNSAVVDAEAGETSKLAPKDVSQIDGLGTITTEFVQIKSEIEVSIKEEPHTTETEETDDIPYPSQINVKTEREDVPQPAYHEGPSAYHIPQAYRTVLVDNGYPFDVNIKSEPLEPVGIYPETELNEDKSSTSTIVFAHDIFKRYSTIAKQKNTCPVCNKSFASSSNMQRHLTLHSRKKLTCHICNKEYLSDQQLHEHIEKRHNQVRKYPCPECGKVFKSSANLNQHKRMHLKIKPFKCDNCHRTFSVKANLHRHLNCKNRCKKPIDQPIICNVCNKEFQKEFLLKSHLRRHDTEKPFYCDYCQMNFKYKSTLTRHIQIHNGLKPYSCHICNKTFTHSGLIKPHMRTHTGEKPYKCTFCSKHFAHKHNMQRHALRHNIIKNLVCDICHKKFPKESRLKYHMKIHVDQKHFSCYICPKKFSHRQNILRHYNKKHPGATYDCKETDASVATRVWEAVAKKELVLKGQESPEEILG